MTVQALEGRLMGLRRVGCVVQRGHCAFENERPIRLLSLHLKKQLPDHVEKRIVTTLDDAVGLGVSSRNELLVDASSLEIGGELSEEAGSVVCPDLSQGPEGEPVTQPRCTECVPHCAGLLIGDWDCCEDER